MYALRAGFSLLLLFVVGTTPAWGQRAGGLQPTVFAITGARVVPELYERYRERLREVQAGRAPLGTR
jgi:hypothetical protein